MTLRVDTVPALEDVDGLVHGFERRLGPPGWESREAGRRRVQQALAADGRLLLLKQVHGKRVWHAPWKGTPEADASLATRSGLILGIESADCLPILLVDPRRRRLAAAHAGWRGTAAGVAGEAVAALVKHGSDPGDLVVALGPCIGACCYEVGGELLAAFAEADLFRDGPRGKPHFDLREANRRQILRAGVQAEKMHDVAECTVCRADLYHSYRRDGPGAGRMISYVGWRGSEEAAG